jgi:hypothetical protein
VLAADSVSSIGKVGAAVGVVVVIWQLALTYLANARRLGADFVDMYERVIERVPLGMLFGESTL